MVPFTERMLRKEEAILRRGERKIRTSVLFLLKWEVLLRHPRADVENSLGYTHLEFRKEALIWKCKYESYPRRMVFRAIG